MKIIVTEQDWQLGTRMCAFECPVWIAVTRKLAKRYPNVNWRDNGLPVIVTSETLVFGERFRTLAYEDRHVKLPKIVRERIRAFDLDHTKKTWSRLVFSVELPKPLRREIKKCSSTLPSGKKTSTTRAEALPITPPSDVPSIERGTTPLRQKKSSRKERSA